MKLNFASCVVHLTRSLGVLTVFYLSFKIWRLWTKPTIWLLILSYGRCSIFNPHEGCRSVTPLDAARVNRTIFHNHSADGYYIIRIEGGDYWKTSAVSTTDGWLKLNFASCVIRKTRSLGALACAMCHLDSYGVCELHQWLWKIAMENRPVDPGGIQGSLLSYGLGRPVINSEIGQWSVFVLFGWRFVFGIIMNWDGREPHIVRCHHSSGGINKAVSLLRLRLKESE